MAIAEPSSLYQGDGFAVGSYILDDLPMDFDDDRLDGAMTGRVEMAFYDPELAVISGPITITDDGAWSGDIRGAGVTADDWVMLSGVVYAPEEPRPKPAPRGRSGHRVGPRARSPAAADQTTARPGPDHPPRSA